MCGIAGFLSTVAWQNGSQLDWLDPVLAQFERAAASAEPQPDSAPALAELAGRFDTLMNFATHLALIEQSAIRQKLERLATALEHLQEHPNGAAATLESLRDYAWQVRAEVLDNVGRTQALMPAAGTDRASHFVAWSLELVLENIDRLEVRGRDSAGLAVQLCLPPDWSLEALTPVLRSEFDQRAAEQHADTGSVLLMTLPDGRSVCRFVYKVANLIGKLGDNGNNLRTAIRQDALLWAIAPATEQLAVLAHTRWASNGIINIANCHPVNASLAGDEALADPDGQVLAALNGDVDNYQQLVASAVESRNRAIPDSIRTDAKIIPILFRLDTDPDQTSSERLLTVMRRLEGSLAVSLLHPADPDHLHLAQKGSGQSLFLAQVDDGWLLASEVYGLAARARSALPLVQVGRGGIQVSIGPEPDLHARLIDDGEPVELTKEPIQIFSRDIFRGDYEYFLEKEIHEAPSSVRKTLQGRYAKTGREVDFTAGEQQDLAPLINRLKDRTLPPVRRIMAIGQGTASVAAMGVAHLLRQALGNSPIAVDWAKASELSTRLGNQKLDDMLVIAISQSGTTTDTNRTVDLARADGAWVHAIVNRRNSPLVGKSDSRLFTSDGRDVEMAVASTKAFYSQIAAGKLTALCLGQALGTMTPARLYDELRALEELPERIQEVLATESDIAACAQAYAPRQRYWAVVGSGPNKIAAEEIRIKLSELCYRSIPCDFTEDKKHIDLSTEPLTLVIANDLPSLVAQDTAKEVAIFKAHNGRPIVFAALGESCFAPYAEAIVPLPSAGAGLDFVMATVAGHLWGFHAAKAIDQSGWPFRNAAAAMTTALDDPGQSDLTPVGDELAALFECIVAGDLDAGLPAHKVALLGHYQARLHSADPADCKRLLSEGIALMKAAYDELSRPIDTIRHQAKTVTVGTTRPQKEIAPLVRRALLELGVAASALAERDRQFLIALSPFIAAVTGGVYYAVLPGERAANAAPLLHVTRKIGDSAGRGSMYDRPQPVAGSKRRALRLGRAIPSIGPDGSEKLLMIPVFDEKEWNCEGLTLLRVDIIPQASLQQKKAMLQELGRYDDLCDAFQEVRLGDSFTAFLEAVPPQALIFAASARDLIADAE